MLADVCLVRGRHVLTPPHERAGHVGSSVDDPHARDFRRGAKQPIEFVFARELPDLYGTLDHLAWPSICGSPSKAVIAYTSR